MLEKNQVKNILMSHAEACMKLAEKLSEKGVSLASHEKQLIRTAMVPALREAMDLLSSAYTIGNEKWMRDNLEIVRDYLDVGI